MKGRWVRDLPAPAYAAEFHHKFYDHLGEGMRIELKELGRGFAPVEIREEQKLDVVQDGDETYLILTLGDTDLKIRYDLRAGQPYAYEPEFPGQECLVKVPEAGRMRDASLGGYLLEFPPTLFLVNGGALVGRYYYAYQAPDYNLPSRLFSAEDWGALNCNIKVEDRDMIWDEERRKEMEAAGKLGVLRATGEILKGRFSEKRGAFVFCDHRSGEIADYVAFETEIDRSQRKQLRIHLYHCKASGSENPGARQSDAHEVLGQVRKCVRWLHKSDLFDIVRDRLAEFVAKGEAEKRLTYGSIEDLDRLLEGHYPRTALYTVHAVQPGFSIERIQRWHDPSLRVMFLSLYDELQGLGVDFRVMGSR
jgi:hypothetical protein